eukprot:TRINITY_DN24930_c0_g1_i2.p1 TRINITY_DN24930_c0_g1~~TRINITY_DN24930_c0_g1_i2.p1  ORF type:complete len:160 (-),score=30.72 TRINITY_DN24930_c0_g1_i2:266-745(-)
MNKRKTRRLLSHLSMEGPLVVEKPAEPDTEVEDSGQKLQVVSNVSASDAEEDGQPKRRMSKSMTWSPKTATAQEAEQGISAFATMKKARRSVRMRDPAAVGETVLLTSVPALSGSEWGLQGREVSVESQEADVQTQQNGKGCSCNPFGGWLSFLCLSDS